MEIDLTSLTDLDPIYAEGGCPWTFFGWPASLRDDNDLPVDEEARQFLATLQHAGVPIGIWTTSPVEGIVYAAVVHESISQLNRVLEELPQFDCSYIADLYERLLATAADVAGSD